MGETVSHKKYLVLLSLVVIASFLFFFRLGSLALTDPDETFYAETAKEMAARGEWLTPHLYGQPQFEKPILFYWLVEVSYRFFGVNEFAARLPSAIFGLLGVMATYLLGAALFTKRAGLLSAFIVAANVEYIALSRACVTDMVLAVFIELALLFFIYGYKSGKGAFHIVSSVFIGLAVLTKGPIGIILPAAIILAFLLIKRDLKAVKKMPFFFEALIVLAIALPWYVFMCRTHGKAFVDVFFGYHNIVRFLEPEHKSGAIWYYYIPIILGGLFPWSAFLPVGLYESFKKALRDISSPEGSAHLFLLLWFFVFFIFFSVSSTKLPTYIFPAFIPLAISIGCLWADLLEDRPTQGIIRQMGYSQLALVIIVIAASAGLVIYLSTSRYASVADSAVISAAVLIAGISVSSFSFLRKRYASSFALIVASVVITLFPLSSKVLPEIERYETSKEAAGKLKTLIRPGEEIGCESSYIPGLAFYTGRFPKDVEKHHNLVTFLDTDKRVWCMFKEKNLNQLYTLDDKPIHKRPSYVVWRLGKRCLFTNKLPEDGAYLEKKERGR